MNIDRKFWLKTALLIVPFATYLFVLPNPFALDDGIRHVVMAKQMVEKGQFGSLTWDTWFSHGILHVIKADPWYLYHLLLTPLAGLSVPLAIDIIAIASLIFLVLAFIFFLSQLQIPKNHILLWTGILLYFEPAFTIRLFLSRPFVPVTAMTLLAMTFVMRRNSVAVFLSCCISVLLSQLFVFPVFFSLLGGVFLMKYDKKSGAGVMTSSLIGMTVGLLLHPQTLEYIRYMVNVFMMIPFTKDVYAGMEMGSPLTRMLPTMETFVLFALLITFTFVRHKKIKRADLTDFNKVYAFGMTAFSLGLFIFWQRAIDFAWPLSVASFAIVTATRKDVICSALHKWSEAMTKRTAGFAMLILILLNSMYSRLNDFSWPFMLFCICVFLSPDIFNGPRKHTPLKVAVGLVTFFTVAMTMLVSLPQNKTHAAQAFSLLESIPADSVVFNPDWGRFSAFVWVRPDLKYVTGIDPAFTYLNSKEEYEVIKSLWDIQAESGAAEREWSQWIESVIETFNPDFMVLRTDRHKEMLRVLRQHPGIKGAKSDSVITVIEMNNDA